MRHDYCSNSCVFLTQAEENGLIGRLTRGDMLQGHVAGKNFMRCSHEGACCGDRFLEVFTRRVLSQGHVVISFSDWFIFRSVAGTCRMNSSHEATLRLTGV